MKKIHPAILTLIVLSSIGFLFTMLHQMYWSNNLRIESNLENTFVFINGKGLGKAPLDTRIKKGKHVIELLHPLAIKKVDTILFEGKIQHLKYKLLKGYRFVASKTYVFNGVKQKIKSFYLSETEVTNSDYMKFVNATSHRKPKSVDDKRFNTDLQPVHGLSYYDALAYTEWLSKITGYRCRLPYEMEWEVAASRGDTSRIYPWGDFERLQDRFLANYHPVDHLNMKMFSRDIDGYEFTAPVKSFKRLNSPFHDIAGNVSEWCLDIVDVGNKRFHNALKDKNRVKRKLRIVKGGSWNFTHEFLKIKHFGLVEESDRNGNVGIRVLIEDPNN